MILKQFGKQAFTLVELLLVVVILGALAAMIVPRLVGRTEQAKISIAKADIASNIPLALDLYELDNGKYPANLQALITEPSGSKNWNGPYIKQEPVDPWGNEYKYRYPPSNSRDYDLYSLGPDEAEGTDDIVNWKK